MIQRIEISARTYACGCGRQDGQDTCAVHSLDERDRYLLDLQAKGICPSCEGAGDHGASDEDGDNGRPYVCHACGGTGKCTPVPFPA